MPIEKVEQPQIIEIDDTLRLRRYDGKFDFAFEWYQDTETVYLVDGVKEPYTFGKLRGMYEYLNEHGELYFIEAGENGNYKPIGDVTFWQNDMPIVIGDKNYRGKHIGRKVVLALIERGKKLGYKKLYVDEIYDYNIASRKCFESAGFRAYEKTEKGNRFVLDIDKL
ncbi:MAG: GNAT family N-acetyltransferase [Oscillospiraceae bacterium]